MVSRETSRDLPPWLQPAEAGLNRYVEILAGPGLERGLMGPREVPRLWDRHILNCAVVADPELGLIPAGSLVADVGSGAGLPGLVWALVRPDISVILIEPLLRRATFLTESVVALGLTDRVSVLRGRAEKVATSPQWAGVDVVTARAVAPMDRLLGWTIPLLKPQGRLVAMKGASAQSELDSAQEVLKEFNISSTEVVTCGAGVVDQLTTVVIARRGEG
jgi:16S rRNA (guanine527-N7)-methyltransferase